jgi:hypothetical protein
MRIPTVAISLLGFVVHLAAGEPPALPKRINVAGADVDTSEHAKPRVPKDPASLSGVYDSHSITDGRQWLELKVHRAPDKTWLVEGLLTTEYRPEVPQIVHFINAPLNIESGRVWFDTGIPNLIGHAVIYREPGIFPKDPKGAPEPAIIMADCVYLPGSKDKPPRAGKPAQKQPTPENP